MQGRDGTQYNVIIAKTPLLAEDGTVTGIASVVTDISDQKRTSAVLERARLTAEAAVQAKSRFLANMSHELRTPLNGVVGMTSLLENTTLDAKQRRFVRTLRSSAEALITLINDVLDLSKAEAGKLELARGPVDLRRELEQVVGLFSRPRLRQGHRHRRAHWPRGAGRDPGRSDPPAPGIQQPDQQRGEIHRQRRRVAGREPGGEQRRAVDARVLRE